MHFVSSSIYYKAKSLAINEGMPIQLFENHLAQWEIQQQSKHLPIQLLYEIYEWASQNLTPGFSIRQGKQLNSDDYGTLGLSWKTCWQAKDVFDRLERFMILITDQGRVIQQEEKGQTTILLDRKSPRLGIEVANEVSFIMLLGILKEVCGKEIKPVKITFQHSKRASNATFEELEFPVLFDAPHNSMTFHTKSLETKTIKADKSIHQYLVDRMAEEKDGLTSNKNQLIHQIQGLLTEALPSGIPSMIQVSEHLGLSPRTLKRRLADNQLTFREMVQNIQQEISTDLLKNTSLTIAEIAFQTGFSEQSAFNRAFKRWTDQSPQEFRKSF